MTIDELQKQPSTTNLIFVSGENDNQQLWLIKSKGDWHLTHSFNREIIGSCILTIYEMKMLFNNLKDVIDNNL